MWTKHIKGISSSTPAWVRRGMVCCALNLGRPTLQKQVNINGWKWGSWTLMDIVTCLNLCTPKQFLPQKKNMWQPLQNHAHQHIESSYELNLEYCLLRFWSGTTSTLTDPDKKAYLSHYPRCSMYGMLSYIYTIHVPNVGTYSIHGAHGYNQMKFILCLAQPKHHVGKSMPWP